MKVLFSIIVLVLVLNEAFQNPINLSFNKFLDKTPEDLFKAFHALYKKSYDLNSETAKQRFTIFKQNLQRIKETNERNLSYKFGINKFTDLTPQEFKQQYLTNPTALKKQMNKFGNKKNFVSTSKRSVKSTNIDWVPLFNAPRDQSSCGSCWAFTTTGVVESNWWKNNQNETKVDLSPQQLVDCDTSNGGCNGGWYSGSFHYVKENGIVEESNYPYTGADGQCNVPSSARVIRIDDFKGCEQCTLESWMELFQQGPIAIAVDAEQFQFYESGIMSLENCGEINHAVIAAGWQNDAEGEVLTIRNSWGNWGEQGYMRIRVNHDDQTCQALNYAYLAVTGGNPPPPPPPPSECFDSTEEPHFEESWKFAQTNSGIISFTATGYDFNIGLFNEPNGYRVFNINITGRRNRKTTITAGRDDIELCSFRHGVNPEVENNYTITFSSNQKSITLDINGVFFNCPYYSSRRSANVVSFSHNEDSNSSRICRVSVTPNNSDN